RRRLRRPHLGSALSRGTELRSRDRSDSDRGGAAIRPGRGDGLFELSPRARGDPEKNGKTRGDRGHTGGRMTRRRWLKSLAILALLPMFGLIFWMSAIVASGIPNVLVMAVNVHGLNVTSFAGDSTQRHAPLSLQVLTEPQQDSTRIAGPTSTPGATPPPAATPGRGSGSRPTPTPSTTPLPLPVPTRTNIIPTPPTATPAPATISGQVMDSQTRLAIVGATVSLSPGGASAL